MPGSLPKYKEYNDRNITETLDHITEVVCQAVHSERRSLFDLPAKRKKVNSGYSLVAATHDKNKKHQLGHHIRTGISPKLATEKPQIEITKRVVFRF